MPLGDFTRKVDTHHALVLGGDGVGVVELVNGVDGNGTDTDQDLAGAGDWSGDVADGGGASRWGEDEGFHGESGGGLENNFGGQGRNLVSLLFSNEKACRIAKDADATFSPSTIFLLCLRTRRLRRRLLGNMTLTFPRPAMIGHSVVIPRVR